MRRVEGDGLVAINWYNLKKKKKKEIVHPGGGAEVRGS